MRDRLHAHFIFYYETSDRVKFETPVKGRVWVDINGLFAFR